MFRGARPQILTRGSMETATWAYAVTATWNANSETDIAGYLLHAGRSPLTYTDPASPKDLGNTTTGTYTIAQRGAWYFALQAYNQSGVLSSLSAEASGTFG